MGQFDTKINLIKYMKVSDLYFMIPLFHDSVILPYIAKVITMELNYFDKLSDGVDGGYKICAPPGTCSSYSNF